MSRTCPTPRKRRHATENAAWAEARNTQRDNLASPDVVPYRCRCGAWHVGHSQVRLRKRIRRALRRTP